MKKKVNLKKVCFVNPETGVSRFDIINDNAHMEGRSFGKRKTFMKDGKSHCSRCKEEPTWCDCEGYWY